ncbi:hypothetical protein G9A89_007875 [Geosiphon pyriformis]|nr:hypothetical protein G9A89_007875 [Geosiphon pyriformis]
MAFVEIKTNVTIPNIDDFVDDLLHISAAILSRPPNEIAVNVTDQQRAMRTNGFRGSPAYVIELKCVDRFGSAENRRIAKGYAQFMDKQLGIGKEGGMILFLDPGAQNIALGGDTLEWRSGDGMSPGSRDIWDFPRNSHLYPRTMSE